MIANTHAAFFGVIAMTAATQAQPFTFTRIVDFNTPIPEGVGTFDSFGGFNNVTMSQGRVIFSGGGRSDVGGIYEFAKGALGVVANTRTPVPGGTGTFGDGLRSYPLDNSGSSIAFVGGNSSRAGVVTRFDGVLDFAADFQTPVPDAKGNFQFFFDRPSVEGRDIAFAGSVDAAHARPGVYLSSNGKLSRVADNATVIPNGGATFARFNDWRVQEGGRVTFSGDNTSAGQGGIYRRQGDALAALVDRMTPVPDGHGQFDVFGRLSVDGNDVAFGALNTDPKHEGLFKLTGGTVQRVVDASTPIPGHEGLTFQGVLSGDLFKDTVIFGEQEAGGVWLEAGGELTPIVLPGDIVDGQTVLQTQWFPNSRDGNEFALVLTFPGSGENEFTQAIYVVAVPSPGGALALGLAAAGVRGPRRRA